MCKWWRSLAPALLAAALAITVATLRPATEHADTKGQSPLRFGPGGAFKVALFVNLYYGEDTWTDWGPAQDAASWPPSSMPRTQLLKRY
ncbi:hypothetical protein ZEAMMB73_Zm00001d009752 [Zea mays]|uniref:Uncharacterized protein n=1 Tax=Zea mays TaxID=4577 RepID=A0A1D6FLM6_MAIZE|nr:hypothetical protein ZEAMMB73_Zm00001d009752 [Zea mays]